MKKQYPWEIQGKRKTKSVYEKRNIYGMTVPERIRAIMIDVIICLIFILLWRYLL